METLIRRRSWRIVSAVLALGLIAGACGSDGDDSSSSGSSSAVATTAAPAATTAAPAASSGSSSLGDGSLGTVEVGAGEDIQIRSLHAISGDVAFLGVPMSRAVDMAVADYGDIHGHSVNVGTWLDDLCSSDGGQAAAQTIVADESVVGVLGTSCSGAATAAAPLITGAGMVLISGSNTSPALTSDLAGTAGSNWSEGYYRTAHNDLYQGAAAAKFAYEVLGASSAATIHDGDPYTEGLATAFANSFSELGGDLQTITAVNKGDTDMVPVLTEVAAGSPDLLFFPIFPPEGNYISQQIGEVAGLENTTLMAADGMLVDNYMEIPESEGVFMSGPDLNFEGNSNAATGQTGDGFLAAYEAEFGEAPSAAFWAHAYDATTLLLSAIEAASSKDGDTLVVDRAGVREFMSGVSSWPGIIGSISCDDFGDCGSQRIAVVQHNDSSDIAAGKNNVVFTFAPGGSATAGAIAAASGKEAVALPDLGGRTVSVAIENAYLPYNYVDAETGEIGGFDYDFFGEICNRLNCELDYTEFAWEGTIQAVGDGTFDTAGGGITITEVREETLDFTDSYISVDQRLIVGLGEDRFATLEEFGQMGELTVCSQTGTTNAETAIANFGEDRVILFETFGFAVQALLAGDCDSVIMDETAGQGYQGENADSIQLLEGVLSADELGVPFPNGSDLVAPFNAAIASMKADGSLFELGSKYFTDAFTVTYDDIGDGAYAEEEIPLTASWRGVTEEAIHIGISMLDFGFLKDVNLSPQGWGDQQLVWETLVANLNSNGGILGRELVVDAYKYYSPIGPILGGIDPEAVCLELAADIETFAILGGFLGPVEDINTCITGTQNTIMVGGRQTAERLAASTAPWIEPGTMKETKMKVFLSLLEQEGLLEGKNIALIGNEDDGPYELSSELLSNMDVNVVLDVGLQIPVGDTAAEDARWDVLVQNVLASGADVAMLVGGERAGIRNLANNDIEMDLYIMNSETFTNLSESVTPEMAEGGISLTGLTEQEIWDDPLTQSNCVIPFKEANPDLVIEGPDQFDEGEEEWYRSIMSYCRWLQLFVMITEAAGPNLTHESFLAAAESMSNFVLPGQPYNSIAPGKYDASDSFRLSVFDSTSGGDQGALVPLTGILDGTP